MNEEDEIPPLDPKKVALFVILIVMVGFAGWRFWRAQKAVAAVAEASKDYRALFPSRASSAPPAAPKALPAETVPSGLMLRPDEKPAPPPEASSEAPPEAPPEAAAQAAVAVNEEPAAPAKAEPKTFNRPKLNSGAFSGLNGGSGVGFSDKK